MTRLKTGGPAGTSGYNRNVYFMAGPAGYDTSSIASATLKIYNLSEFEAPTPVEVYGILDDSWKEAGSYALNLTNFIKSRTDVSHKVSFRLQVENGNDISRLCI